MPEFESQPVDKLVGEEAFGYLRPEEFWSYQAKATVVAVLETVKGEVGEPSFPAG